MAYTGSSIVDYLKQAGQDSSYEARKKLAIQMGILNYSGTAAQNTQMLGSLNKPAAMPAGTPTQTAADKIASEEYQWGPLDPAYKSAINTGTEKDYYKGLNEKIANYQPVQQNNALLKSTSTPTASAPATYDSKYNADIQALVDKIMGYGSYKPYDPTTDPVYQSYANMYNREGDRAFQDTVGNLAAVSGDGRLDSWAASAASQARNNYSEKLMDVIPTLESQNYNKYLQGLDTLGSQLDTVMGADNADYSKYRDLIGDYKDTRNFDRGVLESDRNFNQGVTESNRNFGYQATRDQILDDRWLKGFNADEQQRIIQNALDKRQISVSEANAAFNRREFDYKKEQDVLKNEGVTLSDKVTAISADLGKMNPQEAYDELRNFASEYIADLGSVEYNRLLGIYKNLAGF